jgi:integrase
VTLGWDYDPATGKQKRRSQSKYAPTYKEAEAWLYKKRKELEGGATNTASDKLTVKQYLLDWLKVVRGEVRPNSHGQYAHICLNHVIPAFGHTPLSKLDSRAVQTLITDMASRGYSTATVGTTRAILSRAMRRAVVWGLINRDPAAASLVRVPRMVTAPIHPYTAEQVQAFLLCARDVDTPLYALYALAFSLGLRKGELMGLRWQDVDFDKGTLQVRGTLGRQAGVPRMEYAETKTRSSNRTLRLPPTLIGILRDHARTRKEAQVRARTWRHTGYVFTTGIGTPVDPKNLVLAFKSVITRAGLPVIRFHDTRHTAATLMLSRGVDIVTVAHILGHSSPTITLRIYAHVLDSMRDNAASMIEEMLSGVLNA